jgi:hypothetical protein
VRHRPLAVGCACRLWVDGVQAKHNAVRSTNQSQQHIVSVATCTAMCVCFSKPPRLSGFTLPGHLPCCPPSHMRAAATRSLKTQRTPCSNKRRPHSANKSPAECFCTYLHCHVLLLQQAPALVRLNTTWTLPAICHASHSVAAVRAPAVAGSRRCIQRTRTRRQLQPLDSYAHALPRRPAEMQRSNGQTQAATAVRE